MNTFGIVLASFSRKNKYCRRFFLSCLKPSHCCFLVILSLTTGGCSAPAGAETFTFSSRRVLFSLCTVNTGWTSRVSAGCWTLSSCLCWCVIIHSVSHSNNSLIVFPPKKRRQFCQTKWITRKRKSPLRVPNIPVCVPLMNHAAVWNGSQQNKMKNYWTQTH